MVTDADTGRLHETGPRLDVLGEQEVTLSARRMGDRSPKARQQQPPRDGRVATLQFAACPLTLQRPQGRRFAHVPAALGVHVVYVREIDPPPGRSPSNGD